MLRYVVLSCLAASVLLVQASPAEGGLSPLFQKYLKDNNRAEGDYMEDASLSMMELIAKYGYKGEEHQLQTPDGYILTAFRILPNAAKCAGKPSKPPVIVQHGLLSSSVDWIIMGPENGLGYILSDNCYDVWLGNSRGNNFSRTHVSLDHHQAEFWDFSWHEMAIYDMPTFIEYVLAKSGFEKLFYVGHSQGTTQYFIMDSLDPTVKDKVIAMMALAPVAFLGHSTSEVLRFISEFEGLVDELLGLIGINEFLPSSKLISDLGGKVCSQNHPNLEEVCENVLFVFFGFDQPEMNDTMLPVILGHVPAGSATKQLIHYAQSMKFKKFRYWDYGNKKHNQEHYGQNEPPDYPLENARSNYYLWHSDNDFFTQPQDMTLLYNLLPNFINRKINWDKWNHIDFLWGIDANELVYGPMIKEMDSYL